MVWPFGRKHSGPEDGQKQAVPASQNSSAGKKYLLEDTEPRFANESQSHYASAQEQASLRTAWDTVGWNDFSLQRLTQIPCFRDAGMSGFTSMFVLGSVMFLYHKNPGRAANWAVGGFMLGSIVGWEQCRLRRKKSFQTAQMAKNTVANKEKPMLKPVVNDDRVKEDWIGHTSDTTAKKPWYKLW
ncbi:LANO_0E10880g1_1 [Lachancea nothofagi CBS 11611]|uniref:Cytochrome c oxidase assembly protein COX20, mitochondrial n=1 Tax=Lachancea nothofagi CBS 11611 TaxID=1266666 RepID=A0A1G4JX10_9SACH|nr:LANO_0E10880g1_1 [Lachancea nothofagi CBS 11611]